jgi:hypothetical protein
MSVNTSGPILERAQLPRVSGVRERATNAVLVGRMLATHRTRAVRTRRSGRFAGQQLGSSAAGQEWVAIRQIAGR